MISEFTSAAQLPVSGVAVVGNLISFDSLHVHARGCIGVPLRGSLMSLQTSSRGSSSRQLLPARYIAWRGFQLLIFTRCEVNSGVPHRRSSVGGLLHFGDKAFCMFWNSTGCSKNDCKFRHKCWVLTNSTTVCNSNHKGYEHKGKTVPGKDPPS